MTALKPIQLAAAALLASAYATMVLGAYVSAIPGAGMACPDWPTCLGGTPLPALDSAQVSSEVFHRFAATAVVLSGVALLALELLYYRGERKLLLLTLGAAAVLGVQIALGALTVTTNLYPVVVASHLAVATLFFALALLIALRAWKLPPPSVAAPSLGKPAAGEAEPGAKGA